MSKYPLRPLGDVLTLDRDEVVLQPGELYRTAGIYSFGKGIFEREAVLGAETSYRSLFRLRPGQFVISRLNGWEGAVDVVAAELDECLVSNEYPTFSVRADRAEPAYLRWIARWPSFWELLVPRGSMVRRKRVQPSQLLDVEIPLPDLEEQRRVATKLDQAWTRTELLASRRAAARSLGHASEQSSLDRLFSAIGARGRRISELGEVRGGIQKSPARAAAMNPVRYLTVAHVGRDHISLADPRYFEVEPAELERRALRAGDVLIIEGNGSADQIGRAALFRGEIEPCVHQNHVIRVRPDTDVIEPEFLNAFLNSPAGRRAVQAQARTSSGLQSLSVGRIEEILVPVPSIAEQRAVVDEAGTVKQRTAHLEDLDGRSASLIAALTPSMLNHAFAGLV